MLDKIKAFPQNKIVKIVSLEDLKNETIRII